MDVKNTTMLGKVIIRMLKGEKGEAGISGDYSGLINKPSINGVELNGNISASDLDMISQAILDSTIARANTSLMNKVYPVGSIYISTNNTSPETLFGGTWERIKDKFLLSAGDTYSAGETGGSADAIVVQHSHKESYENIRHSTNSSYSVRIKSNASASETSGVLSIADNDPNVFDDLETISEGENGTGKNMPPYIAVNVWKRLTLADDVPSGGDDPTPTVTHQVTVLPVTSGELSEDGGEVSGSGIYDNGTSCTVRAYPRTSGQTVYEFTGWTSSPNSGEVSSRNPYTFTVTEDVTLYAQFEVVE